MSFSKTLRQTHNVLLCLMLALFGFSSRAFAQESSSVIVPRLIRFAGMVKDAAGKPLSGMAGITFGLYKDQEGGAPLWLETQSVSLDSAGRYSVLLGATKEQGVPVDLFMSGQAQWLGVSVQGHAEQPRVWMVSVPYALKAGDADTLGGLPASAFLRAAPPVIAEAAAVEQSTQASSVALAATPCTTLTSDGTAVVNQISKFTAPCKLEPSQLFDTGINVGVGSKTPAAKLDVAGSTILRGTLNLPATGTASATHLAGFSSQPFDLLASAWNTSGTPAAVSQHFRWQVEPSGSNTASPSGTLNLLYASGKNLPAETGLNIASNGQITFAAGQTLPGGTVNGSESVNGNISSTGQLISTVATGTAPLSVQSTTQVANLNASLLSGQPASNFATVGANNFAGNQTVTGNLSATGVVSGSSYQIGNDLFAFGSKAKGNAFLGYAGNTTTTAGSNTAMGVLALINTVGGGNTASGTEALFSNTSGFDNTAAGVAALTGNSTGSTNTASGSNSLINNTTGSQNTAIGAGSLHSNSTGSNNTAIGVGAGTGSATNLSNSTAVGALAEVDLSNAMVLGSINGVNSATANTLVGIGITAPNALLHVGNTGGAPASNWFLRIEGPATAGTGASAVSVGGDGVFGIDAPGVKNGRFVVYEQGKGLVGINTASPDETLSVNGSADKTGGGSWDTFSDGRLKNVDGSFHSGLEQVLKLRPVRYRYKAANALGISDHEEHIGVVAQEVQEIIPEAVTQNSNGYLLVNNDPIIWAMLNAIKEQQGEFRQQHAELAKALRQIKQQQSRLRVQSSAMRSLEAEVREARETVRKVKAQVAASQPALLAAK